MYWMVHRDINIDFCISLDRSWHDFNTSIQVSSKLVHDLNTYPGTGSPEYTASVFNW